MALTEHKIPIITGRNDTPTVSDVETNHPNGAYVTNKYNALIDEIIASEIASTSDLTEGTNLYYTDARFDTRLAAKTTDNLTEGTTNKYYADVLARQAISVTGNGSYNSSTGVLNISNATISVDHTSLTSTVGLVKTYTLWGDQGETITVGTFTVTDGVDGTNGTNGTNGIDGDDGQGIVATTITDNLNGTHTVEFFTDLAKTQKVGEVILNDGVAGADGADGTNGVDGADGISPTVTVLTQSAYTALGTYDSNTFYVING